MGLISKLKELKKLISKEEDEEIIDEIEEEDFEQQEKVYRLHYLYFNYDRFGEMHDCTCNTFALPQNFSEDDAFKIISFVFSHTSSEIGSYRCCVETTHILNQLGFEPVSKEKEENSKLVDLFSVISTDGGYLNFRISKYYKMYFEWFYDGITKTDVEDIFDGYGIDLSKNELFNSNKDSLSLKRTKK